MVSDALTEGRSGGTEEFDSRCRRWLEAMSGGNEQALGEFFDATLAKVFGVAVRIVGDSMLAEDVVSSVYHEAWMNASRYDAARGRPITWLLAICRNRSLDLVRRESSATRKVEAAAAHDVPATEAGPDALLEATEAGHAVHELLMAMPPDDRAMLALAYFRGFSQQQIADYMSLPLGTVKSRIRRALAALGKAVPVGLQ